MTSKVRQRQTNITRFLEASLLRQAEGKLKNGILKLECTTEESVNTGLGISTGGYNINHENMVSMGGRKLS